MPMPRRRRLSDQWWHSYGDPNLDALVEGVRAHNSDLALGVLNVRSAQLQAHLTVINPSVTAGYSYSYSYSYSDSKLLSGSPPSSQFHSRNTSVAQGSAGTEARYS